MIRIGIDEAGLGPKVGPLVISAACFHFEEPLEKQLWWHLSGTVRRAGKGRHRGLVVDDSKRVYSPQRGLERLEETVLAFLAASGLEAEGLNQLLEEVSISRRRWTERYPWYRGADLELPRTAGALGGRQKGDRLRCALAKRGVALVTIRSLVAHPREYNWVVGKTGSKLVGHFALIVRLIQRVLATCEEDEVTVVSDNVGGRRRYGPLIGRFFRGAGITVEDESSEGSLYRLRWGGRSFRLGFLTGGDSRVFEVALASMQSKYLRELHMELLNAFWCEQVPGLRPTAGYGRDGGRFIRDVEEKLAQLGFDRGSLVRIR